MAKMVIVNDYFVLLVGLLVIRFIFICIELSVKVLTRNLYYSVFGAFLKKNTITPEQRLSINSLN